VIENRSRKFLGESRNVGFRSSKRKYVLFVDYDNIVRSGTVAVLAKTLDSLKNVAVVGPEILTPDGQIWFAGGGSLSSAGCLASTSGLLRQNHRRQD
jgi:GT2 family glycosyltransferase